MLKISSADLSRRQLLAVVAATSLPRAVGAAPLRESLLLSGPPAIVSAPLMHMADTGALASVAGRTTFTAWRDPDQLRMMAMGGKADVLAMPSNVAANLFNRGAGVTLLNISAWGGLWIVTRDAQRKALADYRGEEIAVPFRGDMPDIVLQLLATQQGLDPLKDFRLRYVPTPMEAMQLLITRRVSHALLAEPAISLALRKTQSFPVGLIAPELHRGADLSQEWGRVFGRKPRLPQAGMVAVGAVRQQPQLLAALEKAYAQSLAWCYAHPLECGALMAKHINLLTPEAVADAIAVSQPNVVPAAIARPELEFFFGQLMARHPGLIGGKLPASAFYGMA
ncbi:ABC transporter substrate-binding protein [Simplicispira psychrophila]|uniref:ABC transporter substrate-binding protein n=1 Tax=Simplicispira psychrophila TaxID=80882 RepID=UPI000487BA71|nr:MqnA/MqnD/SBP family protein [Simplicispira psychrophila]